MALYDESSNIRPQSLSKVEQQRVFKDAIEVAKDRVGGVTSLLDDVAFLDQYPGNRVPHKFVKRYEFGFASARHVPTAAEGGTGVGLDALAPVNNGEEILPVNGNLFVNREGAFVLTGIDSFAYVSLTYDADPGFAANNPTPNPLPASGLFDAATSNNGGAKPVKNFYGWFDNTSNVLGDYQGPDNFYIAWDMRLKDKTRGKFLHSNRIPPQELVRKEKKEVTRLEPNTEIEPLVRILECRPGNKLSTDQAYNAAQFKGYLCLVFSGYKILEV